MRRRLVLVAAATTTMVALAFVVPLALLVRTLAAERALTAARQVAAALAPAVAEGQVDGIEQALAITRPEAPGAVSVVLPDGRVLGDGVVEPAEVQRAREGEAYADAVPGGRDLVTPIVGERGTSVVHVRVPTELLTAGVWPAWAVLGGLGLVLVGGALVVADRLGRSVVRPADGVTDAARRLAAGERGARAPVAGPPEIADVGAALNGLADRLDDLLAAEREAAADLSHRLRTPMTALRLDVEALPPGPATARLQADLAALQATVDRVIRRARAGTASTSGCDLVAVVGERTAFWVPLAEDEGRALAVDLPRTPVHVDVDAEDVGAAVDALVGNVLSHTPPGTAFAVALDVVEDRARLAVEDDGPGWPAGATIERGRSGGDSTGLGLDICRRLAEDAGGRIALADGGEGGARVVLWLPVAGPR